MLLSDVVDYLQYGDLAQLYGGGGLVESYPRLFTTINMGLIELHKRFPLKIKEVIIKAYPQVATYVLHSDHAASNNSNVLSSTYYIDDSPYPGFKFQDDIIQIKSIYTERGEELPLNDKYKIYSLFTPTYNSIQIPYAEEENAYAIQYKALPEKIDTTITNITNITIDLPHHLMECLSAYVAHRFLATVSSNPNESLNYYSKFEKACNDVNRLGLFNKDILTNVKLWSNAWV